MSDPGSIPPNTGRTSFLHDTVYKRLTTRNLVGAACIILFVWFVIWLVFAATARPSFQPASEFSAFLLVIGGLMAAIFTTGGIVVTLVSVLTQLRLEDRIAKLLSQAQREVEAKFHAELLPRLEEQAYKQVEGMLAFFQATNARDWRAAQQLTAEALEKYPNLQGARRFIGLRMSEDVETYFTNRMHHITPVAFGPYATAQTAYGIAEQIYMAPPVTPIPIYAAADAPKQEAVDWLRKALDHGEESEGQVVAALTLMYGVNESYDMMLDTLPHALAANPRNRDHLLSPDHLVMLAFACGNEAERLRQLGQLLRYPLPILREQITAKMTAVDWTKMRSEFVDWYALEASLTPQSSYPATIRIFQPRNSDAGQTWFAYVWTQDGQMLTVPEPQPDNSGQQPLPSRTLEELVHELSRQYLFLCPSTPLEQTP